MHMACILTDFFLPRLSVALGDSDRIVTRKEGIINYPSIKFWVAFAVVQTIQYASKVSLSKDNRVSSIFKLILIFECFLFRDLQCSCSSATVIFT